MRAPENVHIEMPGGARTVFSLFSRRKKCKPREEGQEKKAPPPEKNSGLSPPPPVGKCVGDGSRGKQSRGAALWKYRKFRALTSVRTYINELFVFAFPRGSRPATVGSSSVRPRIPFVRRPSGSGGGGEGFGRAGRRVRLRSGRRLWRLLAILEHARRSRAPHRDVPFVRARCSSQFFVGRAHTRAF